MAEELRWESLIAGDGTVVFSAGAEFRNDSSVFIHIREITYAHAIETAANDEGISVQVSKSPVTTLGTSNNPFFAWTQKLGCSGGTLGSGADDVRWTINGGRKWAKGQLTLEPGESLFVNGNDLLAFESQIDWDIKMMKKITALSCAAIGSLGCGPPRGGVRVMRPNRCA